MSESLHFHYAKRRFVKTHALSLLGTKNLHFAHAPFPRFSANEVDLAVSMPVFSPIFQKPSTRPTSSPHIVLTTKPLPARACSLSRCWFHSCSAPSKAACRPCWTTYSLRSGWRKASGREQKRRLTSPAKTQSIGLRGIERQLSRLTQ